MLQINHKIIFFLEEIKKLVSFFKLQNKQNSLVDYKVDY